MTTTISPPASVPSFVPQARRPPSTDFGRSLIWLYGETGVGKTTFAGQFPGVWFWATEAGQEFIDAYTPLTLTSWPHFLDCCAKLATDKPTHFGDGELIKYICIDTVGNLWKMCNDHVCQGLGIVDPSEMSHGKAWARVSNEFERVMNKFRLFPYGLILISHVKDTEVNLGGTKKNRLSPEIGAGGYRWVSKAADFIFYCTMESYPEKDANGEVTGKILEQRILRCHPTSSTVGKCRPKDKLPAVMPMDYKMMTEYLSGERKP